MWEIIHPKYVSCFINFNMVSEAPRNWSGKGSDRWKLLLKVWENSLVMAVRRERCGVTVVSVDVDGVNSWRQGRLLDDINSNIKRARFVQTILYALKKMGFRGKIIKRTEDSSADMLNDQVRSKDRWQRERERIVNYAENQRRSHDFIQGGSKFSYLGFEYVTLSNSWTPLPLY